MPVYDQVKQALQDFLAPELQALKAEIRRLDEKIDSLRSEMDARFSALEGKMGAMFSSLDEKVEGLKHEVRTVLEIRERLAALEAKVGITRP